MNFRDHQWQQASVEFMRAVRGKRSQRLLSERLGYRSKPVADWESGRRFPSAGTALRACQRVGIEVDAALKRFAPHTSPPGGPTDDDLAAWLRELRGRTPIVELSARSGQPRFSVSRWLSGQSRPRLPQFFALVDAITGRVSDLIAALVDIDRVPAVAEEFQRRERARRLASERPWSAAVLRVLETEAYARQTRHRDGWIAEYLGFDRDTERACLRDLEGAGLIHMHDGKYRATPETVDTRVAPEANRRIKSHWARAAAGRAGSPHDRDLFAYNVVSVSRTDLDKIDSILRSTFREIRSLVSASAPSEEVALVQLQLVTWDPPRASPEGSLQPRD